jgi:hypothetical protein
MKPFGLCAWCWAELSAFSNSEDFCDDRCQSSWMVKRARCTPATDTLESLRRVAQAGACAEPKVVSWYEAIHA